MALSTYTVVAMTCQHCVASVAEEVSEVAGVSDVQLTWSPRRRVTSERLVDDAASRPPPTRPASRLPRTNGKLVVSLPCPRSSRSTRATTVARGVDRS